MDRVDKLLAAMTVEEKIGQLNMAAAGFAVTGPVLASRATEDIRAGHIGSLLNLWGARDGHANAANCSGEVVAKLAAVFSYRRPLGLSARSPPYI